MPKNQVEEVALEDIGHPKGTLAVVLVYMLLFVIGWLGLYFFTFLPRGTPDAEVHDTGPAAVAEPAPGGGPGA